MSDCQLSDYAIIEFFRSGRVFLATDLDGVVRVESKQHHTNIGDWKRFRRRTKS
jgi:hypothetical protein